MATLHRSSSILLGTHGKIVMASVILLIPLSVKGSSIATRDSSAVDENMQSRAVGNPLNPLELPILTTLFMALGILAFIFPFRIFRFSPTETEVGTRKGNPLGLRSSTLRPMDEVAALAREIVTALEEEKEMSCLNYTACSFYRDIFKLGGKQEITLSLVDKWTPSNLKSSLVVLKETLTADDANGYCEKYNCNISTFAPFNDESKTDVTLSPNNNLGRP